MDLGTIRSARRLVTASRSILAAAVAVACLVSAPNAQTLPMPVPAAEQIQVELQPTVRGPGLLLTWPVPERSASTRIALVDTAVGLDFPVTVGGAYNDNYDRLLRFVIPYDGGSTLTRTVGTTLQNRFVCAWSNANSERTGVIGGEINLSNTGGVWVRDAGGVWSQLNNNEGLPRYLPYTNIVHMANRADGTLFAVLSSGALIQNDPVGLFRAAPGQAWQEVAPATFGKTRRLAVVALHPTDANRFAAGDRQTGLFVTSDGGATFTQWTRSLDPDFSPMPVGFEVTALTWTAARLYVAVLNMGLFVSADHGATFTRLAGLSEPDGAGGVRAPEIRTIAEDPSNSDRILVGIASGGVTSFYGIYESLDAGATWTSLNNTFVAFPDDDPETEPDPSAAKTVLRIDINPTNSAAMLIGTATQGLWYTTDGGQIWYEANTPYVNEASFPTKPDVWDFARHGGAIYTVMRNYGVHVSSDQGQSWSVVADQPFNKLGRRLLSTDAGLVMASTGGGIFSPPVTFPLSAAMTNAATAEANRNINFGIDLTFGPGSVTWTGQSQDGTPLAVVFSLICETFQGWVVWRAMGGEPDNMAMIGRFDLNNPETCIEGFCGDDSYVPLPNCFAERRAACFDFGQPGYVSFYDGDIFNGFSYFYAITPFDYGNTAMLADPVALNSPMVFPARFPGDSLGEGPGNRFSYDVNLGAQPARGGEGVYVFPNPLRRGRGIAGGEGEQVIWTNLPPSSRVQVFTLAGDQLADLPRPGESQDGSNIFWVTRNEDNQLLAAGIYLWRVIMPEQSDHWGKLVIIR